MSKSWSYGYDKPEFESATAASYKWQQGHPRTERVIPDTRAAHFVLGDDKSTWDTAAASFGEHKGYARAAPLKPASGSSISLGTSPVNYTTAVSAAFSSSLSVDTTRARPVDRGATALVLGDDKPVYETESMHQTQKGAVTSGPLRAPERARGRAGASFVLGSSPAEYTTTTSSSMIKYDALKAGRTVERMPKPTQPAIAFGDDTVEYVTNRMSEEGSSVRKAAQRYIPASGLSSLSALPKASPKATVDRAKLAGVSWKLGSDVWKPESAATASFQWPTPSASGPAAPVRPVAAGSGPVKSNIHFGDEPGRFTTESAGVFSAPDTSSGGGRQPILKPGGSGSVSFGSDAVMYKSAYSSSLGAIEGADLGAATAARTALKQSMQQRSIQLGDDSSIWETAAQASAKAADAATLTRPEARRGQAPASFTFGSSAPEYSTTSSEATSAVASSKTIPRTAAAAKSSSVIVMGDDAVDYVTNRMSEEGSQTKTLKQRYVPKVPTLTSAR